MEGNKRDEGEKKTEQRRKEKARRQALINQQEAQQVETVSNVILITF